ncbi:WD40 repeat domain-containing protein [Nocardioides sp.]|uniref:WD40 repeat domain-containing protein n=1 Tax=Nocardioides sp. TaxID=35761 RepID=UPI003783645E
MTDRLSTLLHDEAGGIPVPPAPGGVLAAGRREVRRRRTRTALAGAVAAALVAVAATVAVDRWTGGGDAISPADRTAYREQGAWIVDDRLHIAGHTVRIPDAVGMLYTAQGVLVGSLDGDTSQQVVTLVTPDGRTRDLGHLGGVAADPRSPEIVFARSTGDHTWQLVTWDLATDEQRPLGEPFESGRSTSVALGMSDPYVVFLRGQRMLTMDRHTGETGSLPQQDIGLTLDQSFGPAGYLTSSEASPEHVTEWLVRSLPDGRLVGSFPDDGAQAASVSPDGRYLETGSEDVVRVYDVATGARLPLELPAHPTEVGWTPDGDLVAPSADRDTVLVCSPTTGACDDTGTPVGDRVTVVRGSVNSGLNAPTGGP